jgi:hypothetical protein
MPPRIHCIRGLQSSSSSSPSAVRYFTSTTPQKTAFPSASRSSSVSKTPSKYQLLRPTPTGRSNSPSQSIWGSSKNKSPISAKAFEINAEQNATNEIRPNPTMIDTAADVDEAALRREEAMNAPYQGRGISSSST